MQQYKATGSYCAEPLVQYFHHYLEVFNLCKAGGVMKTLNRLSEAVREYLVYLNINLSSV